MSKKRYKMVWILLALQVSAFVCHKGCLNSCKSSPTTECIMECCPDLDMKIAYSCALTCDEIDSVYQCNDTCIEAESSCDTNCGAFCDARASGCKESCLEEFCGRKPQVTNWIFVIGLIMLFCIFVVVLFKNIANVNRKVAENEYRYT